MNRNIKLTAVLLAGMWQTADADLPKVEHVKLTPLGGQSWRLDVSVSHADSGWDHYVNGWRVSDETGKQLGFRVLHHPHVNEQPFSRSLTLHIADTSKFIHVQAIDFLHGEGELSAAVRIPR